MSNRTGHTLSSASPLALMVPLLFAGFLSAPRLAAQTPDCSSFWMGSGAIHFFGSKKTWAQFASF